MQYVALTVVVAGAAAGLGWVVRAWYRNAPLRREMRAQAITFQTQLSWVKFSDREVRNPELIVRGEMFRVDASFGLLPNLEYYFRAPGTTIELSRNPPRIYGVETRQEWIVVRGSQAGRKIQLSMTTRYFLDDVWNALIAAGAVPTSGGPSPQAGRTGLS